MQPGYPYGPYFFGHPDPNRTSSQPPHSNQPSHPFPYPYPYPHPYQYPPHALAPTFQSLSPQVVGAHTTVTSTATAVPELEFPTEEEELDLAEEEDLEEGKRISLQEREKELRLQGASTQQLREVLAQKRASEEKLALLRATRSNIHQQKQKQATDHASERRQRARLDEEISYLDKEEKEALVALALMKLEHQDEDILRKNELEAMRALRAQQDQDLANSLASDSTKPQPTMEAEIEREREKKEREKKEKQEKEEKEEKEKEGERDEKRDAEDTEEELQKRMSTEEELIEPPEKEGVEIVFRFPSGVRARRRFFLRTRLEQVKVFLSLEFLKQKQPPPQQFFVVSQYPKITYALDHRTLGEAGITSGSSLFVSSL